MSEYADERDSGNLLTGLFACVLALVAIIKAAPVLLRFTIDGLGEVDTSNQHPTLKHGFEDVERVLIAARALSADFFRKQGPCLDAVWRIVIPVDDRHNGLLVLEKMSSTYFRVKTAFVFSNKSKYAKNVMDNCFGTGATAWTSHSLMMPDL